MYRCCDHCRHLTRQTAHFRRCLTCIEELWLTHSEGSASGLFRWLDSIQHL